MKNYNWNIAKNVLLKIERNISFEEIINYLDNGYLIDTIENPNQEKYTGQKMFVININEYIYLVPFVENETEIFLKTIMPSRKATKKYLEDKKNENKTR
ncbi:MAG: toxin [FCB group bacterium]|jgi:hypothetical protein